jgi:carboxyl-terminal processing protease
MMKHFRFLFAGFWALVVSALFIGCNSDEPKNKNQYVNDWILENMEFYYLWNNDIPNSPNKSQEPDLFFESLLSDEDRFSWIQDNYEELLNSLQGVNKEAGYEFKLYRESSANENVIAQVMYIKAGSPAASADLLRGDVITHINGELITLSNYQSLLGMISENHNIRYKRDNGSGVFVDKGTLSLTTVEFAENPHFMHTVLDYPGAGKKIGYYVYNFFAAGPSQSSTQYNTEMDNIFTEFKNAGITDLVLDFRYNSGGAESATIRLASLIGQNVDDTKIFVRRSYNNALQAAILDDPNLGADFLIKKFENKTQNIGTQISGKLYVLTGSRTASASELLINGLKPYMSEIFIIGDTTIGKNVGSVSLYEANDPKNTWGMQPIVVKSYNSLNESDYSEGFIPNIANNDNSLYIFPLGDPQEELLSLAIGEIVGSGGRKDASVSKAGLETIGSSVDRKRGRFNLLIDDERLVKFLKSGVLTTP